METQKVLVIKRRVKYPRLELKTGSLVLILPQDGNINAGLIIKRHQLWINKKLQFINEIKQEFQNNKLFIRKDSKFVTLVESLIDKYSQKLKIQPAVVKFRYMKTRWGSCSKDGRISLNKLLMFIPDNLVAYVIYHELCHLVVPKHNRNFWLLMEKEFSTYKDNERSLFGYWFLLNKKLSKQNYKNLFEKSKSRKINPSVVRVYSLQVNSGQVEK